MVTPAKPSNRNVAIVTDQNCLIVRLFAAIDFLAICAIVSHVKSIIVIVTFKERAAYVGSRTRR